MSVKLLSLLVERLPKNARVLDVGCGGGALVRELNKRGFSAEGFDYYLANEELLTQGVFKKHDVNALPFPYAGNEFDCVVNSFSFRFVREENTAKVLYELDRIAKVGGLLVFYDSERLLSDRLMSFLPWRTETFKRFPRFALPFSRMMTMNASLMVCVKEA